MLVWPRATRTRKADEGVVGRCSGKAGRSWIKKRTAGAKAPSIKASCGTTKVVPFPFVPYGVGGTSGRLKKRTNVGLSLSRCSASCGTTKVVPFPFVPYGVGVTSGRLKKRPNVVLLLC